MREKIWRVGDRRFDVSRHALIMGVLNVTPDSFSDGGEFFTPHQAIERGVVMAAEGAHIIDVGGESTRPGSEPIAAEEELRRVIPVIEKLRQKIDLPISIDTSKAEVARAAIEAGASIVNDVTGGRADERMLPLIANTKSAFIIMHMHGTPRTMQIQPRYTDVVAEISDFFRQQYARAIGLNIDPMVTAFDPGTGFRHTLERNSRVLAPLKRIRGPARPLVAGLPCQPFLQKLIGSPEITDRLVAGVAMTAILRGRGGDVFRVHDVKENVYALQVAEAVLQGAK